MNELISVIIPVYNVEKYLDKCISSVVNQTYKNLEIILVDDGSPDNCPSMCDEWAKKDTRIKVIHKKNGGLSDARNAGIDIATGDWIGFVDSDDYIEKDMYKILYSTAVKNKCEISCCNLRMFRDIDNNLQPANSFTECVYTAEEALSKLIDDEIRQVVYNKLYQCSLIKLISFPTNKYHEDEFWSYQIIGKAKKIATIDYTGYNYYQHPESIMGRKYSLKRLDAIEAKTERQSYLEKYYPALSSKGKSNLAFTCIYNGQLAQLYLDKADRKIAFDYLDKAIKDLSINLAEQPAKNKIWLITAQRSLKLTCRIRNLLKIGM